MLDSSTALMLLILLGVVVLVILVIAFMMNMKRSEAHNDQVLESLDNSITELQGRMSNVENNRSTMTTGAISPREPAPIRQDHQLDGVTPSEEETPAPAQDARKVQEPKAAVDDFWSSFQHVSANTGNQENKKETTTENGFPNKQEEPAVDFGVFQRNADLARPAKEASAPGGASPLDRQQGSRHGMGGMLDSFGFGKGSDTLVMERPQAAPQAPAYGMPQNPSIQQPSAPDLSDLFQQSRSQSPSVSGQSQSPLVSGQSQSPLVSGQSQSPLVSGPSQSPLVSGQSQSPLVSGQSQSPLVSGQSQSPLVSGQATPYGNQPANPYGNQPQANPYGNQPQANPYGNQPQANPYGNQQSQSPSPSVSGQSPLVQGPANSYGNQQQPANPYGSPMHPSVQYGGQPPMANQGVGAPSPGPDSLQDTGLSLAEQLQQATQRMQEMAKQARDAVPQAEAAAKAAQQARTQHSAPAQAPQPQVQHSAPAPAAQPQRQAPQTAQAAPDYFANRNGGVDKQGRVYSVEQLNAQIK